MLVPVKNIHLMKFNTLYLSNEDNSMMIGAFTCKGVVVKDNKEIVLLQPLGLKNTCEFDLKEVYDHLYFNDYREIDELDRENTDTQDEYWLGVM